ncbi:unnamed protein product, partial [Brassica oleracea]
FITDLKSGRCSQAVVTPLLRFWVPRNVKQRGRELTCFCLMR